MILGIFSIKEIIDAAIMTFIIGLIFSDFFSRYNKREARETHIMIGGSTEMDYDPVSHYKKKDMVNLGPLSFNWDDMKLAILCIAPAIILHELGHKLTAMAFGASFATFEINYFFLGLALMLKILGSPFIFLVPAFVRFDTVPLSYFQIAGVAIAGPLVNLTIFIVCYFILKYGKRLTTKTIMILGLTKQINLFLGLFNLIPIPPFDGGLFIGAIAEGIAYI